MKKQLNEILILRYVHTLIMTRFSTIEMDYKLTETWDRESHNHFEHTTETLHAQIKRFDRQLSIALEDIQNNKDVSNIRKTLMIFKKDRQTLKNNLQLGKVRITKNGLLEYVERLNDAILIFEEILKDND